MVGESPTRVAQRGWIWMASRQTKGEGEDQIGRKERVERRKRWRERGGTTNLGRGLTNIKRSRQNSSGMQL